MQKKTIKPLNYFTANEERFDEKNMHEINSIFIENLSDLEPEIFYLRKRMDRIFEFYSVIPNDIRVSLTEIYEAIEHTIFYIHHELYESMRAEEWVSDCSKLDIKAETSDVQLDILATIIANEAQNDHIKRVTAESVRTVLYDYRQKLRGEG